MTYDEAEDSWKCPAGQTLHFRKESKEILESGYKIRKRHYRSQNCEGCPLKERYTKATGNREVMVSLERLRLRYHKQAREMLRSEEGYLFSRTANDGTGKRIWTTEEQPGIPAFSASRHRKSDA
ncbi:hypothetical protein PAECIP111894_04255 [Paenibacillus pseudetheri]|uniref:Transposase DDE domain-containing protein n=1 Tax=Paenibacillus pseudetheri TaxID=2897682 RepID=A0ABN8FLL8_9BACL|nr:transposase [Paenibacillus pseudetheri]CAH1058082.1 hypothetical protein PAECIP111894_04255 [Paenibacillus pseudetheri]